jgi:uncharacterized OsmC-like protein
MKAAITYEGKKRFVAKCENAQMVFDLPLGLGGDAKGVGPPEAFAVSLAACKGYFALGYCQKNGLSAEGMTISMEAVKNEGRISSVSVELTLPNVDLQEHGEAIKAFVKRCTVWKSIETKPDLTVTLK